MSVLDFAQGYGAVQLAASVSTYGAPVGVFYHDYELASEAVQYYSIFVTEPEKGLSVTVAWFDPPSMVPAYNVSFFFRCGPQGGGVGLMVVVAVAVAARDAQTHTPEEEDLGCFLPCSMGLSSLSSSDVLSHFVDYFFVSSFLPIFPVTFFFWGGLVPFFAVECGRGGRMRWKYFDFDLISI